MSRFARFAGAAFGSACLGGVLAAAGEYLLSAFNDPGGFWGSPRFCYQLLLGVEALWAAALSSMAYVIGGSAYFIYSRRRGPVRLDLPAAFILTVALTGIPFFRLLATANFMWFWYKPELLTAGGFTLALAVWGCAGWVIYRLICKGIGRLKQGKKSAAWCLRAIALIMIVPFLGAEAWALWEARNPVPDRPDIYLVVMDAFRADRLSYYGAQRYLTPALEAFGSEAVVFKDFYTVSSWTKPAITSLFTAVYPGTHGVTSGYLPLPDGAQTLAEVLRAGGYRTIGVSANANVTRPARMDAGFEILDDVTQGPVLNGVGPSLSCARPFIAFISMRPWLGPLFNTSGQGVNVNARLRFWSRFAGERPTFYYVHYMEPHFPNWPRREYSYELQPFLARVDKKRVSKVADGPFFWYEVLKDPAFVPDYNADEIALARALYDADIRRMDVVIEGLLEGIVGGSERGSKAIVVITADHGEEFLEHGRWLHGAGLHYEVARVPLMIKAPGVRPAVIDGPVNLIDVPRTLMDFAGLPPPRAWEGLDLRPYMEAGAEIPQRELLLDGFHAILLPSVKEDKAGPGLEIVGIVTADYFYLKDENAGLEYLYDRRYDPRQEYNLVGDPRYSGPDGVLELCRNATARMRLAARKKAYAQGDVSLPPSLARRLKTLGYVR